jgi:hypothetical protein
MTSKPGVFACGNVLHVHDLVDYACEEAERCADGVHAFLSARGGDGDTTGPIIAGANVRYVVPSRYDSSRVNRFYLRPMIVGNGVTLASTVDGQVISEKKIPHAQPSEMISINLTEEELRPGRGKTVEVSLT